MTNDTSLESSCALLLESAKKIANPETLEITLQLRYAGIQIKLQCAQIKIH